MHRSLTLTVVLTLGCIGDGGFRVTGTLVDRDSLPLATCRVGLVSEKGAVIWEPMPVPNTFRESFIVSPFRADYFVTVQCPGMVTARIPAHYGRGVGPQHPLELGTLVLNQEAP